MNHKMSQELPVGVYVQLDSKTGSVCHFFWRELTLKSCTCSTGATGMGSPAAGLAATWAACLAALLVEGLARGWAALGAGLAGGLAGGSSPCGKHNRGRHNTAPRTLEIGNSTSQLGTCQYDQHPWLRLRKNEVFRMIQGTVECLGCKKPEGHSNVPIVPPCPASKRTGEARYPTF